MDVCRDGRARSRVSKRTHCHGCQEGRQSRSHHGQQQVRTSITHTICACLAGFSAYVMLQWACARIGAILVTLNPAYRVHELIATLSLAQVNHLFVVPRIRSSAYLDLLASALPSLQSSTPGALRIDELPDLRNIIVVDDLGGGKEWEEVLSKAKCAVDFREILVWRADGREQNEVTSLEASSNEHEVINLQFTR